jgi:pimeloyl-ACP methyl ester carboxylesterase
VTPSTGLPGLNEGFIAGTGLRVFSGGEGPPVVLLHGLAGCAANWVEVAAALAARHRVLALELPGHGGSPPLPESGGIDAFADAVAAAIEAEAAAPALVVGHSFGGQVALRVAERSPALVRGLLLVAPSGIETRRRAARIVVLVSAVARPGARIAPLAPLLANRAWFRRAALRPWYVSDAAALSGRATRGLFAELRSHTGLRAAARAMLDDDPRTALHRVGAPTLILWGARDAQLPLDDAFDYARRLDAPIRLVADCGHLLVVERPAAVLDAVGALAHASSGSTGQTGFSTSM